MKYDICYSIVLRGIWCKPHTCWSMLSGGGRVMRWRIVACVGKLEKFLLMHISTGLLQISQQTSSDESFEGEDNCVLCELGIANKGGLQGEQFKGNFHQGQFATML